MRRSCCKRFLPRFVLFVVCSGCAAAQHANIWLEPAVIAECAADGTGRAIVRWSASRASRVQVRVDGVPMSGLEAPAGSGETGDWVRDGLTFVLTDAEGTYLASTRARVRCGERWDGSWMPLRVGNRWVWRVNDRLLTARYLVWQVARSVQLGGEVWFEIVTNASDAESRFMRTDSAGRVYIRRAREPERLWLDPSGAAGLRVQSRGPFDHPLGHFDETIVVEAVEPLLFEVIRFARGTGIISRSAVMATGSSGGFLYSWELVDTNVLGASERGHGVPSVELSVEREVLEVSSRQVSNCAVPCYFVACTLVPGADPPNTYKPCSHARTRIEHPTLAQGSARLTIEMVEASGRVISSSGERTPAGLEGGEWVAWHSLPLYSAPNQPLPAGSYSVRVRAELPDGHSLSANVPLAIR